MSLPRGVVTATVAVAVRPRLWPAAIRAFRSLVPTGWWRRPPFIPRPDPAWVAFRMTTAYGEPSAPIDVADLIVWLEWSATVRTRRRRSHRRGTGGENAVPGSVSAG